MAKRLEHYIQPTLDKQEMMNNIQFMYNQINYMIYPNMQIRIRQFIAREIEFLLGSNVMEPWMIDWMIAIGKKDLALPLSVGNNYEPIAVKLSQLSSLLKEECKYHE